MVPPPVSSDAVSGAARVSVALLAGAARGDVEEAGRALRAWAKKRGKDQYDRRLVEAPEVTYEDNEHLRGIGRLA
jgi:hypothetical protein